MAEAYDGEVLAELPQSGPQPYEGEVLAAAPKAPGAPAPSPGDINPQLGVAEGGAALLSGAAAAPVAGLTGMGTAIAKALGITDADPADIVRKVQEALTYQPRSTVGQKTAEVASYPFEKLAEAADTAGGKVAEVTGSPALGAAVNAGIQTAVPMGLAKIAPKVKATLVDMETAARANRARIASLDEPVRSGIDSARRAGYVVSPSSEGAGGVVSRSVEGVSGEPKVAKLFSRKNAAVTNDLIRKDVGLPDDVPLSREALHAIIEEEGMNYEAVKRVGTIENDGQYFNDLKEISRAHDTAAKSYPHRSENPFQKTLDGLKQKTVNAAAAIEEVKLLRKDANKAFANRDKHLGQSYRDAAEAIDDAIDRHLQRKYQEARRPARAPREGQTYDQDGAPQAPPSTALLEGETRAVVPYREGDVGPVRSQIQFAPPKGKAPKGKAQKADPALLDMIRKYQDARTRIAKAYQAEKALNETTGNIDASVYAQALKKKLPLSGAALQVAEFARQFPRLAQNVERIGSTGPTYFDLLAAGVSKEALLLGARPIMRSLLASKPAQAIITKRPSNRGSASSAVGRTAAELQGTTGVDLAEIGIAQPDDRGKRRGELLGMLER